MKIQRISQDKNSNKNLFCISAENLQDAITLSNIELIDLQEVEVHTGAGKTGFRDKDGKYFYKKIYFK